MKIKFVEDIDKEKIIEIPPHLIPVLEECDIISQQLESESDILLPVKWNEEYFKTFPDLNTSLNNLLFYDFLKSKRLIIRETLNILNIVCPIGEDNTTRECGLKKFRVWMEIESEFNLKFSLSIIQKIGDAFLDDWNNPKFECGPGSKNIGEKSNADLFSRFLDLSLPENEIYYIFAEEFHKYLLSDPPPHEWAGEDFDEFYGSLLICGHKSIKFNNFIYLKKLITSLNFSMK